MAVGVTESAQHEESFARMDVWEDKVVDRQSGGQPISSSSQAEVRVHAHCPNCREGTLWFTGGELESFGDPLLTLRYLHRCNSPDCGRTCFLEDKYPKLVTFG